MKSYCNPVNMIYRFMRAERRATQPCREGSDPALVRWRGRYLLATSKTSGAMPAAAIVNSLDS